MRKFLLAAALPLLLAACGADNKWASDADVARFAYRSPEPASITLYTAINNRSGEGGHSALLINGSEQVMWDPAGTWWNRSAPERHDVIHGITPTLLSYYIDYHARETYHVVEQKFLVSPQVAEMALAKVESHGAVNKAMCASTTSSILGSLPGFESVGHTWFPARLMKKAAKIPGVQTRRYFDNDSDDNSNVLTAQDGSNVVATAVTLNGQMPPAPAGYPDPLK